MAKYTSHPGYTVVVDDELRIEFDRFGYCETSDKKEIAALDALVPRYVRKVDEDVPDAPVVDVSDGGEDVEPEPKQKKKPGAKSPASGK